MKLRLENLPPSLDPQRDTLARCIDAFDQLTPIRRVYLFGSHARREARPDSDVDLCIVAEVAEGQQETARRYRAVIWEIWPRPSLTLIPIVPARLAEKQAVGDLFCDRAEGRSAACHGKLIQVCCFQQRVFVFQASHVTRRR